MAIILNLETSTSVCSVSVTRNGEVLSCREQLDAKSHAARLVPFIAEALEEAGIKPVELTAIAVSKGPGSYTGLRIGVSTAKGIAYALNIPVIAIDTLYSMATGFLDAHADLKGRGKCLLCPMIDARRMEVYTEFFNTSLNNVVPVKAEIVDTNSFQSLLEVNEIHFFGDGAMKCKDSIRNKSAYFYEDFHPSSTYLAKIAFKRLEEGQFENLAYFEPFYLKDFVAIAPGNKMV